MKRGVVYALTHPAWLEEILLSTASVREHMPDLAREVYATQSIIEQIKSVDASLFTDFITVDKPFFSHRPRFESMLETKLDQVIFLDSDTYFVEQTYELFELLDLFDIGMVTAPQYFHPRALQEDIYDLLLPVPEALPEWNGGVLVTNITPAFHEMVHEWMRMFTLCRAANYNMDQPSLRSAIATSKLRVANLPNNYNFRANVAQMANRRVKILHAHGELERIAGHINNNVRRRFYQPNKEEIHGKKPKGFRNEAFTGGFDDT